MLSKSGVGGVEGCPGRGFACLCPLDELGDVEFIKIEVIAVDNVRRVGGVEGKSREQRNLQIPLPDAPPAHMAQAHHCDAATKACSVCAGRGHSH